MKSEQSISQTLREIANEGTAAHTNPWPVIAARIEATQTSKRLPALPSKKALWLVLAILTTVATVAYGYYRLILDPGLQGVDKAGLIAHLDKTAQPTVFRSVPTYLVPGKGASQAQNGITVNLDWAYVDDIRLAMHLTIKGLSIPSSSSPSDFICSPQITNRQGLHINPPGITMNESKDEPGNPIEVMYISYQDIPPRQYDHLDLDLDLTIGPCSPVWNYQETNLPTVTPVPLIGNYHLSFQAPIYQGTVVYPKQSQQANGVTMRLNEIHFARSFLDAIICYQLPKTSGETTPSTWSAFNASITVNGGAPIFSVPVPLPGFQGDDPKGHCEHVGFAIPSEGQPDRLQVTVPEIISTEDESSFLSPDFQKYASTQLEKDGIILNFTPQGNTYWSITQKPANMTDDQVTQKVYALLIHHYPGPWIFSVTK